jgi:hypothetical protein
MNSKLKLAAGPAKVSAKPLTAEEIQNMGLKNLESPLCYGLITSLGWHFTHVAEGMVIIFDINKAIKISPDVCIIEWEDIIGKLIDERDEEKDKAVVEFKAFKGFGNELSAQ